MTTTPTKPSPHASIGAAIVALREATGLPAYKVAEEAGLYSGTLSKWETGQRVPQNPAQLAALAAVLARHLDREHGDVLLEISTAGTAD